MNWFRTKKGILKIALAVLALTAPALGLRAVSAAGNRPGTLPASAPMPSGPMGPAVVPTQKQPPNTLQNSAAASTGRAISKNILDALAIPRLTNGVSSAQIGQAIAASLKNKIKSKSNSVRSAAVTPQSGEPVDVLATAPFSAGIIVSEGGRNTQFNEVLTLGDWDGAEDLSADHSGKVYDLSANPPTFPTGPNEFTITREAISEHTIANGFPEDVFYFGDSFGNVYILPTTNLTSAFPSASPLVINLPTALNAFGSLNSDDQVVITGLAVSPVVDLTSFSNVNGAYSSFAGQVGEVLYVTFTDTESGFRLASNVDGSQSLVRSGVLAFPIADPVSPAPSGAVISSAGFPVTVGQAFGVAFSVYSNLAGCAVDDDGSLYFSQVDLVGFTGGNIVKITSTDQPGVPGVVIGNQDRSLATSGIATLTTLNPGPTDGTGPKAGFYFPTSGPATQVNTFSNYSGASPLFGNVMALATGPCNSVYAAVARSKNPSDDQFTQNTEGLFSTSNTALGATPSMVIRFTDVVGSFAQCTVPVNPISGQPIPNSIGLPIGDGIADAAQAGQSVIPGVNNFRVFVLGNGPDIRTTSAAAAVGATMANTLRITDGVGFQVDATIHSGITVNEEGTVYVVSGGTPAGIGTNPSASFGEILIFPDSCPADGRADFVDLRGANTLPNPPSSGANAGDGLSTRTDHIFWQAPIDVVTATPTGIAGLNHGFLLYLNRTRTADNTPSLPNGTTQSDDGSNGPVIFEQFDPSHQVAGGDDQIAPFTGDDNDGAGNPVTPGPLSGGFEFLFANPTGDVFQVGLNCGDGSGVWNGFFLNANGNITFGGGDSSYTANILSFRSGLPKIAAAWTDLNPGSRESFPNTFPVQALGFAGINDFVIRNINIPESGLESCNSSNTFSTFLFDDGTGIDENANQTLNKSNPIGNNSSDFDLLEGPTALRYTPVNADPGNPATIVNVGCPVRQDGTGHFCFQYCRMDILGTANNPVIAGFSIGAQNPVAPPGLCSTNLSTAAVAADTDPFRPCLVGEGTEPTVYEYFNTGTGPSIGGQGSITFATPAFDLRFEGNDPGLAAAINTRQTDLNRGRICFYGTTCQPPPNPTCLAVYPTTPVMVPPGDPTVGSAAAATPDQTGKQTTTPTAGIINAVCGVQLNVIGCGIIPNETTVICQGFASNTGVQLQRPGKTVSTTMVFGCDSNGDGVPDLFVPLTNVTPVSANLIQGTLAGLSPQLPGTPFPLACCGGVGTLTTTTTFTAGDNNIFNQLTAGGFTRSMTCAIDVGLRAPVVISASPAGPLDCGTPQNLLISGSCFILPGGVNNVSSVYAVDQANPSNIVTASNVAVLDGSLVDALFNFGTANAGHTFLIYVSGPTGTSMNLAPGAATCLPNGGNQQGVVVTFTCASAPQPPPVKNVAVVTGCSTLRNPDGTFVLRVTGQNIQNGAAITVNGGSAKVTKFKGLDTGSNTYSVVKLRGKVCKLLPGPIVVTNPGGTPSQPFSCLQSCQ